MKNSTNSVIADYERRVRFFDRMEDVCSAIVGAASVFFLVGALTLKNVFVSAFGQNAVIAALVLFSAPLILGMQGACASISRRNHWHAEGEKKKCGRSGSGHRLAKPKPRLCATGSTMQQHAANVMLNLRILILFLIPERMKAGGCCMRQSNVTATGYTRANQCLWKQAIKIM